MGNNGWVFCKQLASKAMDIASNIPGYKLDGIQVEMPGISSDNLKISKFSSLNNLSKVASLLSITLSCIFFLLSFIHFYWAFGGVSGKDLAVPERENGSKAFLPGFWAILMVAIWLFGCGIFILAEGNVLNIPFPALLSRFGLGTLAVFFLLRAVGDFTYFGFFKMITRTEFGKNDTRYYTPLCLFIGVFLFLLEFIK